MALYPDERSDENMLKAAADKPLSTVEIAMMELEQEIMSLDEMIGGLSRKLQPVQDNTVGKNEQIGTEPAGRNSSKNPLSPMAQSITEKANRVSQIRDRIRTLINSIDL